MKTTLSLLTVLFMFATISCAPGQKESQQQSNPQQMNQMQISRLKQDASTLNSGGTPATTAPVQNSSAPVRLNPPHGQPGHICEIPVGSPLPTAPVQPNATVNSTPGAAQANSPSAPTAASNVRLNPPHGQPGHICEIPVGSPLPSE